MRDPRQDLYRYVNGEWLATHQIPPDRGRDGAFHELNDQAERDVLQIIEDCSAGLIADADAQRIGALYNSFMDTPSIAARGTAPLSEEAHGLVTAKTKDDLAAAAGALGAVGGPSPLEWGVSNDPSAPERYTMFLAQGGLGLPDEAYYRQDSYAPVRAKYVAFLDRLLELTPFGADTPAQAGAVMEFETRLARGHWDQVQLRDAVKTNNPMDGAALAALAEGFPFQRWAAATGRPEAFERLNVMTPSFFAHLGALWQSTDLETLRLYLLTHLAIARAPYLTDDLVQTRFDFYGRVLTGAEELKERWKRGVALVDGAIPEGVGRLYVERHFPPAAKARMDQLVGNLIAAYRASIAQLTWMGEETRARALEKLDGLLPKIGYPDTWRDYSALAVGSQLIPNVRAAARFTFDWEADKLTRPVDRSEWLMPPQMVNAYYMPTTNEIAFPAAILQPPFFDSDADDAVNYAAIGAVIGHEIGHAFDDQGSRYDATGRLADWWTQADREAFEKQTASLIAQYDALTPAQLAGSDHHVNGALTIGENIGDVGGLSIALKAYRIALDAAGIALEGHEVDGLPALQRFFLSWARVWREKARDADAIRLLAIDPHSPAEFRCNQTARNIDAFHAAFGTQPGDGMWLDPAERVTIW